MSGEAIEQLARALAGARAAVALSGAGISTESGLPDFRGPGGLWRSHHVEEVASLEAFLREPQLVWDFYRERLSKMADVEPNAGHRALARLERLGLLERVITQNIDGLHERAGSTVIPLHGTIAEAECIACGRRLAIADAVARAPEAVPPCDCGANLKPAVILFGQLLPERELAEAEQAALDCDLMLVLGSSLYVQSRLVWIAHQTGARIAILNRGETACDELAAFRIDAGLGETLQRLVELVESRGSGS